MSNINGYRINQINKRVSAYKNPFNSSVENMTLESVRKIATYCEMTKCEKCQIKNLILCNGKLDKCFSPSQWCE